MIRGLGAGALRAAVLVVAGTVLGLGCNAVRPEDRIDLGRRYFTDIEPPPPARDANGPVAGEAPPVARVDGFAVVTTDEAKALLDSAGEMPGGVVFVDARDADHFEWGHLPGALNVDYYNADRDLRGTLDSIAKAATVVVYCSSKDCDDGLLLCRELRDMYAVPAEHIVLYRDGMRAWEARGLSVERAR